MAVRARSYAFEALLGMIQKSAHVMPKFPKKDATLRLQKLNNTLLQSKCGAPVQIVRERSA